MKTRLGQPDRDAAETLAIRALGFLARDGDRLGRFLSLTGIGPGELRGLASDPALLGGVLEHLLGDETLLLVFATEEAVPPADVALAHAALTAPRAGAPRRF